MALTNAERQARYRASIKNRASLDALGEQAARAADRAIAVLWAIVSRPADDGRLWGGFDDCKTEADLRAQLAVGPTDLVEHCRAFADETGVTDEERAALVSVIAAYDALTLASDRPKGKRRPTQ